jgi:hypothetical protein
MHNRKWVSSLAAVLVVMLLAPAVAHAAEPLRGEVSTIFTSIIKDVNGNAITFTTDPSTLLYTAALGTPLLAPDGHHITWGEWFQAGLSTESVTSVKCVSQGTHVTVEATDLIPNALYTVWIFTVATPTSPLSAGRLPNALGQGKNHFTTDETGAGTFNAIAPGGPLSINGQIPNCLLDNPIFVIQLAYHSDGQLYGPVPGPAGVTLDHINFVFRP